MIDLASNGQLTIGEALKDVMPVVWIPPGQAVLSEPDEDDPSNFELVHWETKQGFWMGATAVTQHQFRLVAEAKVNNDWSRISGIPSLFSGFADSENRPVDSVVWDNAMRWCDWLTSVVSAQIPAQHVVTLPTGKMWEYAYRFGLSGRTSRDFENESWYVTNSGGTSHSVGEKKPLENGLCDMSGNVFEWCRQIVEDPQDGYNKNESKLRDPERMIRGGTWLSAASELAIESTDFQDRWCASPTIGFRICVCPMSSLG